MHFTKVICAAVLLLGEYALASPLSEFSSKPSKPPSDSRVFQTQESVTLAAFWTMVAWTAAA